MLFSDLIPRYHGRPVAAARQESDNNQEAVDKYTDENKLLFVS